MSRMASSGLSKNLGAKYLALVVEKFSLCEGEKTIESHGNNRI